ncbi:MAG: ImmA/IrrE family metallo-endopeptidase [Magnetococcales bacterium]|nr:ImmA/IrrE family metallo-endopeptidase [Magnetococcales bacterium]
MSRMPIEPELLRWARERASLEISDLEDKFPRLRAWEEGSVAPTLAQLEKFARAVYVPSGYLFLPSPPEEPDPIPDFRTMGGRKRRLSPNLLDTIYLCQQRQEWYREYALENGIESEGLVGVASVEDDPVVVAAELRERLGISIAERKDAANWREALRRLFLQAEEAGVLVMASSVVGSDNHRPLDVQEFRGFAIADAVAPLIFINTADSKAAQMFTLGHELAHLCLGESGISDPDIARRRGNTAKEPKERWCNKVAAELLLPMGELRDYHNPSLSVAEEIERLARLYKVSTLVALRRLFDAKFIDWETFQTGYREELVRISSFEQSKNVGGGDFYNTLNVRVGKRFAYAVISSTLGGRTLYTEAFRMLGVRKTSTFREEAYKLGVIRDLPS